MAPLPKRPETRDDLTLVEIDDEALVYDPASATIHHLNRIGKLVFQLCDGKATTEETAAGIAEAFGYYLDPVQRDVRSTVTYLRREGLLKRPARSTAVAVAPEENALADRELIRLNIEPSP